MKHCIIEDASFIVATIDKNDAFHGDAVFIFKKLLENRDKIKIIVPPLGLYEIIVTLRRKGVAHSEIEKKILNLLHIKEIIITSITEASAFKHCKTFLNINSQTSALRCADFLIVSLGMDYEAQILTFDKKMWTKVKPVYNKIYYCSSVGNMRDESNVFLNGLYQTIGNNAGNIQQASNAPNVRNIPF